MLARCRVWRERSPPGWARVNTSEQLHARIIDLRAGSGQEHLHCKPRGRAVVVDPRHVRLAPLWNEAILDDDFPRWQDGSAINASEFRRCGAMGYRFDEWLRVLLPPNSTVWRPQPTPALPVHSPGTIGTDHRVVGRDEPCVAEARDGVQEGAQRLRVGGLRVGEADACGREAARLAGAQGSVGGHLGCPVGVRESSVSEDRPGAEGGEVHAAGGGREVLVAALNSVQSNFMAPYDFLIVGGSVVRQAYGVRERPLMGAACWVFQICGAGSPRVLRVQVGAGDVLVKQAEADEDETWQDVSIQTGVSGLPIILNGVNVCCGIRQRSAGKPMRPNTVTWDPATTRAAFTAIGSIGADKSFVVCISVLEEMTVSEFAECVRTLGVQDALLLGGSGDVHMWVQTHEEEAIHAHDAGNGVRHRGVCGGVTVNEGHILMAQPRAGGTRVTLGPGQRPLNALLAAFLLRG